MVEALEGLTGKILLVGLAFLILATFAFILFQFRNTLEFTTASDSQTVLGDNGSTETLSTIGQSAQTLTATRKNTTWLDFDGTNDLVYVSDNSYETISFWFKNDTVGWQHLVNTSDTLYINGSEVANFQVYPIIYNGSDYIFGKTDSTTFFAGSIDDIRFYDDTINESIVDTIFNAGR